MGALTQLWGTTTASSTDLNGKVSHIPSVSILRFVDSANCDAVLNPVGEIRPTCSDVIRHRDRAEAVDYPCGLGVLKS